MRSVSRFEVNLLTILEGLLGRVPLAQALPLVLRSHPRPKCLSCGAVEIIQGYLSKGVVLQLARGCWQWERFLRRGEIAEGRLWERTSPDKLALRYSANTLDFLIWLTATDPLASKNTWKQISGRVLTLGDRLVLLLAYQALRNTEIGGVWCREVPWKNDGMCNLLFAEDFAGNSDAEIDFKHWITGAGAAILEAWQAKLAQRWIDMEREKARQPAADKVRQIGRSQTRVLSTFLNFLEKVNRRDLSRFLFISSEALLRLAPTATHWTGSIKTLGLRMADRAETYRSSLALLWQLEQLGVWNKQARAVGYFDEGYAASQLWKADWEAYNGDAICEQARVIIRQAEPMGTST
jgi:hypothetical protein